MQLDTARRILTVNPPKIHPCLAVAWHADAATGARRYGWCYQHPRDVLEYIAPQPTTLDQLANLAIEALKPGGATAGILGVRAEAPRQSLTPPRGVPAVAVSRPALVQPTADLGPASVILAQTNAQTAVALDQRDVNAAEKAARDGQTAMGLAPIGAPEGEKPAAPATPAPTKPKRASRAKAAKPEGEPAKTPAPAKKSAKPKAAKRQAIETIDTEA